MRKSLLNLLCCPEDGSDLDLHEISVDGDVVSSGVLECKTCGEVWTVIHAIPRFVSPSSVDLHLDSGFVEQHRRAIDDASPGLADRVTAKISRLVEEGKKEEFSWNRDEMVFWEKDYENRFHNDVTNKTTFNRILPRQKYIMDPLRGEEIVKKNCRRSLCA